MADQEVGNVNKTGRGVLYSEQPDGTFARILEILLRSFNPVGAHATDATISSSTDITPPSGANKVLIQAFGADVRYTLDGTTPTASVGFQLKDADPPIVIPFGPGTVLKVIEEAASATVDFQFGV